MLERNPQVGASVRRSFVVGNISRLGWIGSRNTASDMVRGALVGEAHLFTHEYTVPPTAAADNDAVGE